MDKKDLSNKILADIKEKNIKPRPKWYFTFKNISFAGMFTLMLALGSIAFSIMLFLLINNDWDLRHLVAPGLLAFLVSTLPYVWIILFVIFVAVSYFIFRLIKGGYRYKFSLVSVLGIVAVLAVGSILYKAGLAKTLDLALRRGVPQYQRIIENRNNIWLKPEEGVLIGKVVEIKDSNNIVIIDPVEHRWIVDISHISPEEKEIIIEGWPIKIIGEIIEKELFGAEVIRIAPKGFYLKKMNMQVPVSEGTYLERNIYQMRII